MHGLQYGIFLTPLGPSVDGMASRSTLGSMSALDSRLLLASKQTHAPVRPAGHIVPSVLDKHRSLHMMGQNTRKINIPIAIQTDRDRMRGSDALCSSLVYFGLSLSLSLSADFIEWLLCLTDVGEVGEMAVGVESSSDDRGVDIGTSRRSVFDGIGEAIRDREEKNQRPAERDRERKRGRSAARKEDIGR